MNNRKPGGFKTINHGKAITMSSQIREKQSRHVLRCLHIINYDHWVIMADDS